jgi:hypothetical protein
VAVVAKIPGVEKVLLASVLKLARDYLHILAPTWLVSMDRKHLATEPDFDAEIRMSRERFFSAS